jgi:hypothetical protein
MWVKIHYLTMLRICLKNAKNGILEMILGSVKNLRSPWMYALAVESL